MHVGIIIPVHNRLPLLQRCLAAVRLHTKGEPAIIVVDDGSTDPGIEDYVSTAMLYSDLHVEIIHNEKPVGFSQACNQGMERAARYQCTHYVLLNTDTEIGTPDWLHSLDELSKSSPDVGLFGPVSNNATGQSVPSQNGSALPPGETVPSFADLVSDITERRFPPASLIHGFCYIVRREVIEDVGNLDAETFPHYGSEDDLSLRAIQAGWKGTILDDTFVYHVGRASYTPARRSALVGDSVRTLMDKYGEDYVSGQMAWGSSGLEYMRVAMAEHYKKACKMPRRVQ